MFEIITGILIAFFTIVGINEIFQKASDFLFGVKTGGRVSFLVTSCGHDEQLEYTVRSLMRCAGECSPQAGPTILVVDNGMDTETRKVCEILSKELGCLKTCQPEQLPELIGRPGT